MKVSPKQNYNWTNLSHFVLDPFVAMVALGAVGHMRHMPVLYSFSYAQMFLINVALQFIFPVISDPKIIPSKEKIEL